MRDYGYVTIVATFQPKARRKGNVSHHLTFSSQLLVEGVSVIVKQHHLESMNGNETKSNYLVNIFQKCLFLL